MKASLAAGFLTYIADIKNRKRTRRKIMAEVKSVSVRIGDIDLVFETGKIAKQANGAVYAQYAG